ncbi:hydroxylamine reductase [Telmatobacter bradus]|uniref:hydroxylamine reductase n=1 Tax=Telmatobacter bradus TaxID=474953 RepID=UPI003B4286C4
MFCYQCEQTAKGEGCQTLGVCGKDETTATLQDLLLEVVKGISMYAHRARQVGAADPEVDAFTIQAVFATLTNVNFDPERLVELIQQAEQVRTSARDLYEKAAVAAGQLPVELGGQAALKPAATLDAMLAQGKNVLLPARFLSEGKEIANLRELVLYGIKGVAAYAAHALALGAGDPASFAKVHETLDLLTRPVLTADELLGAALAVGELNYRVMEVLDHAHTETFGHPQPTAVRIHPRKGKAILISGHDLHDLYALLEQTKGTGIQVYTHGEMLPAHGYPKLKAFENLAGNYGGAWQDQADEFDAFPGAILMTSNCIQQPKTSYKGRIFTAGPVQWPGVEHISGTDFSLVIAAALAAPGYEEDGPDDTITVGFAHNAVLSVADKVIDAVKAGAIRRFFLVGGCDGARSGRNYYTELAEKIPADCIILTLACGKYRFNKLDLGTLGGLPRLLDMGQCNDAYSALQVALALAKAFECGVNDLPLSLVLSWYEQKAVAVLLTLLHLGVRNIRIGPTLPAFLSPDVLKLLGEKFNLMAITTADADLAAMLG